MAPDDWGSARSDDYDAVVAELRALSEGDDDDLDALAAVVAALQATPPVAERGDWTLPDFAREAIWARVDAHITASADQRDDAD